MQLGGSPFSLYDQVKDGVVDLHGPGLLHTKQPVEKLEDLKGMKIRAGSPVVHDMLAKFGAEPVAIPVPSIAEALTTGVIDGATFPWDLTQQLRIPELVRNHTMFAGPHGLYTLAFVFPMNLAAYEALPEDIRAVFDAESGVEMARQMGKTADQGDLIARKIAEDMGNNIIVLDEAETARWVEAAQPTIEQWYGAREAMGIDGRALHERAKALIAAESGP
jgi:TRAP-type transport system periplasmic protein